MGRIVSNPFGRISTATKFSPTAYPSYVEYQTDMVQLKVTTDGDWASTFYTISKESPFASKTYVDCDVRVVHLNSALGGAKLNEDWRMLIYKDISSQPVRGEKYVFNDYTWMIVDTDNIKSIEASGAIRRCNHELKWYDEHSNLIQEPCAIDYFKFTSTGSIQQSTQMRVGDASRYIILQANSDTLKLARDKRFIFENRAWRIVDVDTLTKYGLIQLSLEEHQVNSATDDIVNDIADAYLQPTYTISVLTNPISLSVGGSGQIEAVVLKDGEIVVDGLTYRSSSASKVSVTSYGLLHGVAVGSSVITVSLSNNSAVTTTVNVSCAVSPSVNVSEVISGDAEVKLGQNAVYEIYKYVNGVASADVYTFSLSNSNFTVVSSTAHTVTLRAGSVMGSTCVITAVNGTTLVSVTKTITVIGMW